GGRVEALARIGGGFVHEGVIEAQVENVVGIDGVDFIQAAAPVFARGQLAAGNVIEVVVLGGGERVVADVEREPAAHAHVVVERPSFVVRGIGVGRRGTEVEVTVGAAG